MADTPTTTTASVTPPQNRRRLPHTRPSITRKFVSCNHEMYATVGFFEDRSPGEVFVQLGKHGSELSGMIDGWCVAVSLGLQYGVPWPILASKFRHTRFGQPEHDGDSSILDGIAKHVTDIIEGYQFVAFEEAFDTSTAREQDDEEGTAGVTANTPPKPPAPSGAAATSLEAAGLPPCYCDGCKQPILSHQPIVIDSRGVFHDFWKCLNGPGIVVGVDTSKGVSVTVVEEFVVGPGGKLWPADRSVDDTVKTVLVPGEVRTSGEALARYGEGIIRAVSGLPPK